MNPAEINEWRQEWDQVANQMWDQVRWRVGWKAWDQVLDQVANQVWDPVWWEPVSEAS